MDPNRIEYIKSIFQSVVSKFAADRDDAISKINRALQCNNIDFDVEKVIMENIQKLSQARINIATTQEELQNIFGISELYNKLNDNLNKNEDGPNYTD